MITNRPESITGWAGGKAKPCTSPYQRDPSLEFAPQFKGLFSKGRDVLGDAV
jgi:hypothetical protein